MLGLGLRISLSNLLESGTRIPSWVMSANGTTPIVDYDFKNNRFYGPNLTITRASSAYIDDSQGNWTLFPANTLRRSDKGVLIEGAQTNSIRNNSMQGAVIGSPGTDPTGWSIGTPTSGFTRSIVGLGTIGGIDYIDIRLTGTNASAQNFQPIFDAVTNFSAGQLWSSSAFVAIIGGSITGISSINLRIRETQSGSFLADNYGPDIKGFLGSNLQRFSFTPSGYNTSTNGIQPSIRIGTIAGATVEVTIRIGWPQLEQWASSTTTVGGASSPIRTTGTAATRAADVVTTILPNSLTAGGMAAVFNQLIVPINVVTLARLGISSDRAELRINGTAGQVAFTVGGSGQPAAQTSNNLFSFGNRAAIAGTFTSGDSAVSLNNSTVNTAAPTIPVGITALTIGSGTVAMFGYIERLVIWPRRLSNTQLQNYSTLSTWN